GVQQVSSRASAVATRGWSGFVVELDQLKKCPKLYKVVQRRGGFRVQGSGFRVQGGSVTIDVPLPFTLNPQPQSLPFPRCGANLKSGSNWFQVVPCVSIKPRFWGESEDSANVQAAGGSIKSAGGSAYCAALLSDL